MNDLNLKALLQAASFEPKWTKYPSDWYGHLPFAYWLMHVVSPKLFVDLGTTSGISYFSFCQSVYENKIDTKCIAIGSWDCKDDDGNRESLYNDLITYNNEHYQGFSNLLRISHIESLSLFADKSIDLIHIDGLNGSELIRNVFQSWLPKLAYGAVIILHDINQGELDSGLSDLWKDIQREYPYHFQFFHSSGLGIAQLPVDATGEHLPWLRPDAPEKDILLDYFSGLGERQVERYEKSVAITEQDLKIIRLTQAIAGRDVQIDRLNRALAERDMQLANFSKIVAELDMTSSALTSLVHSRSWKITAPLRLLGFLLRGEFTSARQMLSEFRFINLRKNRDINAIGNEKRDYSEWIRKYDTFSDEDLNFIRMQIDQIDDMPLISVIMPVFDPPIDLLEQAILSVRYQAYPHWELCIADDASKDESVRDLLRHYAAEDSRIKVVYRKENGHISASSNSALELAKGEYIVLLDHDDLLPVHALYCVAEAIRENPDVSLIYSDGDKIDIHGNRSDPYFKSDFDPYLLLGQNFIAHLGAYRTELVREIGGFRLGLEGAQDWDLALRCVERLRDDQILHIPRILYHWRIHEGSTARSGHEKPYALEAGIKVINDHLERKGVNAHAELLPFGMYRVHYSNPTPPPRVSLIIPTRNGYDLLRVCVESILSKTVYPNYEILIVDNSSDDPKIMQYFDKLNRRRNIRIIRDERPFNYSALNNSAVQKAEGSFVGLLNNDIEVITHEWLDEMVSLAALPDVGAVGARLWYPNNTLQHGGVLLGLGGVADHAHKHLSRGDPGYFGRASLLQSLSAVTGACLVIRKETYLKLGGLNEKDLKIAFNDIDFCIRLINDGYRNIWTPFAELYHHESATRGYEDTPEKQTRFAKEMNYMRTRWGSIIFRDPAYNPNLTFDSTNFSYAWPPRLKLLHMPDKNNGTTSTVAG